MSNISSAKRLRFFDVLVAPGDFFSRFDQVRNFSPLVLISLIAIVIISHHFFYSAMSDEWLFEQQLSQVDDINPTEQEVVHEFLKKNLPYAGMFSGLFTAAGFLVQVLLLSVFYFISSRMIRPASSRPAFRDWFNLVSWCQVPWLINYGVFVFLFSSSPSSDLPLSLTHFASVGQIFVGVSIENPYYKLLQSISLFHVWVIFMTATAIARRMNLPLRKALLMSAAPFLLFFGMWAVLI